MKGDAEANAALKSTPLLRTYVQDVPPPHGAEAEGTPGSVERVGRWLAQDRYATAASGGSAAAGTWPACFRDEADYLELQLHGGRSALLTAAASDAAEEDVVVRHLGQPLHGSKSGDWLGWGEAGGDDGPDEQSLDDGLSFCLTSAPLTEDLDLVGFPTMRVQVSVDQAAATLNARLTAVLPDGTSWLLSRGTVNLNHTSSVHKQSNPRVTVACGQWIFFP